ncbi:MAG: hypothetical protein ACYT04_63475 [Nostoc sp.]
MKFKRIGASLRDATRTPSRRVGAQREAQRHIENSLRINEMLYLAIAYPIPLTHTVCGNRQYNK